FLTDDDCPAALAALAREFCRDRHFTSPLPPAWLIPSALAECAEEAEKTSPNFAGWGRTCRLFLVIRGTAPGSPMGSPKATTSDLVRRDVVCWPIIPFFLSTVIITPGRKWSSPWSPERYHVFRQSP
ncbi:MAG TPA: hypothetical protein VMY35_07295, partial [Phycisphaerae bacterium]|nr:hypothetical protein [Phycisphaerae bacterium]